MNTKTFILAAFIAALLTPSAMYSQVADTDSTHCEEFITYETMPEFPGGTNALLKFLADNIRYPNTDACVQGRVIVDFVVNEDGSLSDFRVRKSLAPEFDKEALRVLKLMPKWRHGMERGKYVKFRYRVPVKFRLAADSSTPAEVGRPSDTKATPRKVDKQQSDK